MAWYKNMTGEQRNNFNKVLAVSMIGTIIILIVPMVFHFIPLGIK